MSTYLGAATELGPEDVDPDLVARRSVTYLEGYLWDKPRAKEAFRVAMAAAHGAGRRVSLTLSDSFCVERHRDEFRALVDNEWTSLFANQERDPGALPGRRPRARRSRPSGGGGDRR